MRMVRKLRGTNAELTTWPRKGSKQVQDKQDQRGIQQTQSTMTSRFDRWLPADEGKPFLKDELYQTRAM